MTAENKASFNFPFWLNSIPENWSLVPVKRVMSVVKESPGPGRAESYDRLSLTMNGVLPRSKDDRDGLQPADFDSYQLLRPGQLVFKLIDLMNVATSRVGISEGTGLVSPAYIVTEVGPDVESRFAHYYFLDLYLRRIFNLLGSVGVRSSLGPKDLMALQFVLPPLDEQRDIADYLDQETAQIDALVAKQEEFIGLLRERRISAVDAILDGLKWVVPLSTQTALIQTGPFGSQLKSTEYVSRGVPLINPSHIGPDGCLPDPTISVSKEKAMQLSRHALQSGDLIVARRGELARSAVIHENERGFLCGTGSAIVRPIPTRISTDYLNLIYRSRRNSDALSLSSNGSTMDSVNAQTIGALRIPVPDLVNQRRIVDQAKHQTTRIDALIAKAEEHIALAKERRSALITAAVTGQFDVRTAQKGARA